MPVTFVVGRAGSGKTTRTLDRIAAVVRADPLGRPVWLLVPKQATFEYERALTVRLGAFSRVRVVGFDQLYEAVLREVGGVAAADVTPAGRRMVIGRLLYRHRGELAFFGSSARRPGMAAAIDALFDDFERSGRPLDEMGDVVDQLAAVPAESRAAEAAAGPPVAPVDSDDAAPATPPTLRAKLADLRLLYGRYRAFLGQDRLDPERRRQQVLGQIGRAGSLAGSTVYIDAFHEFTDAERRTLAALAAGSAEVEVNLALPPDAAVVADPAALPAAMSPFHRTEAAYRRLHAAFADAGAVVRPIVKLDAAPRFASESLRRIERGLFSTSVPSNSPTRKGGVSAHDSLDPTLPGGAIEGTSGGASRGTSSDRPVASPVAFIEASDPRAEVGAVARHIVDLLRVDGYRQRDVLVLARDLDDSLHLVHAAFAEHGLTYFADRRRPATHHPLVRLVRAAVRVARENWAPAAVLTVVKTGLAGVTPAECDRLANYVADHGVTAAAWLAEDDWAYGDRDAAFDEEFDTDDGADAAAEAFEGPRSPDQLRRHLHAGLRPLADRLARSADPAPLRLVAADVFRTLDLLGARRELAAWVAADRTADVGRAEEHAQVWRQLCDLVQQMVDLLGDDVVEPGEFAEVLETGLDAFDLAIAPPVLDQVLVGSVDRTRSLSAKAVFVLGLNRGTFPRGHRDDLLLSGPERRELHRRHVDVDPDPTRRLLDERFLAYNAFTRASHRLFVSRPRADEEGREQEPSEFWAALRAVVPDAPVEHVSVTAPATDPGRVSTPRDVVAALMAWARTELDGGRPGQPSSGEIAPDDAPGAGVPPARAAGTAAPQAGGTRVASAGLRWQAALYDWLVRRPAGSDAEIDRLAALAWPALCYTNDARLSHATAARLFSSPLSATAAQLESFASCPFQHFAAYGLGLSGRADGGGAGGVSPLHLSRMYHDALEAVIASALASAAAGGAAGFANLPPEALSKVAREKAAEVARALRGAVAMDEARAQYLLGRVARTLDMVLGTLRAQLGRGVWGPMKAGVPFGSDGAKLAGPAIDCGGGRTVRLRGRIDRVDRAPDGGLAVYDYRLGEHRLSAANVYHGLSLRLLACVLVLDRAGGHAAGRPLVPVAAFCARLLRSPQVKPHPDECLDPASEDFLLAAKPRGAFCDSHFAAFDKAGDPGWSPVVAAFIKKEGEYGFRNSSDVATVDEFGALVDFVERKVAELAGGILDGNVTVAPYLYYDVSPCPRCDFRSVCRFEVGVNRYRKLESLGREQAIDGMRLAVGRGSAGEAASGTSPLAPPATRQAAAGRGSRAGRSKDGGGIDVR